MRDTTRIKPIKSDKPLGQPSKPKKRSAAQKDGAVYPTFPDQRRRATSKKPAQRRDESVLFYRGTPPKGAQKRSPQKNNSAARSRSAYAARSKTTANNSKRRSGAIASAAALMVMVGTLLVFVCFGPGSRYAASYISDVHASFVQLEEQVMVDRQTDDTQQVPSLMERAEENAQTLVENGTIESYEVGEDCVYMQTTDGLGMVYLPEANMDIPEGEQAAAPTPYNTTVPDVTQSLPAQNPATTPMQTRAPAQTQTTALSPLPSAQPDVYRGRVISLQPCYDMFLSSFSVDELENIDQSAARFGTLSGYVYDPVLDDYDNAACTVDLLKSLGEYDVVIWEGHGGYSSATGSFLLTGQEYTAAFHRQNEADFADGSLISTTNGRVAVTAGFFEKHLPENSLDGALVYLAACSTCTDERLVSVFLEKGADVVYANSGVIYTVYNYAMLDRVTSVLCGQTGSFQSAGEALTDAQLLYGYYDNYRLSTQAGVPTNYSVVRVFGDASRRFS